MEAIILKIVLSSTFLITFYYLFLEKERIFRFNRIFLLFSLVFSYVIPFVSVKIPNFEKPKPQLVFEDSVQQIIILNAEKTEQTIFNWENLLFGIYFLVTLFLLIKSLISIFKILNLKGKKLTINSQKIKILDKDISPFSFLDTIYLGKNYFENEKIDERIFLHEQNHIQEKHSFDLIFIEILMIFSWFNPALYFYKKAMVANHEFLADENVLSKNFELKSYQNLLLEEISNYQKINFTHQFNFNNTKKRFIMMTTKKSKISNVKKIFAIPLFAMLFALFVQKVYARNNISEITANESNLLQEKPIFEILSKNPEIKTQNPFEEIQKILSKYSELLNQKKYLEFSKKVSLDDKQKLFELYSKLTKDEKEKLPIVILNPGKLSMVKPTENQLNDFKNIQKYGVWIDGKKVDNNSLNKYKITDFSQVFISKVYPNARNNRNPQPFQVSLMTNSHYEKYISKESNIVIGFKGAANKELTQKTQDTIKPKTPKVENDVEEKSYRVETNLIAPPMTKQQLADYQKSQSSTELPQFPGGNEALRRAILKNMDISKIKARKESYKGTVFFNVWDDGSAADFFLEFEDKEFQDVVGEAVQKSIKNVKWKPSTKDGKLVDSQLKIPITMSFQ